MSRTFVNPELNASNVIEVSVHSPTLARAYSEVKDILDLGEFDGVIESASSGIGLYSLTAQWNGDLRWVSAGNELGFAFFDKYFGLLEVASKTASVLRDNNERIMYSGFFVVRSQVTAPYYHHDYSEDVGMSALTLMTPVSHTGDDGHLLYEDVGGKEHVYRYETGSAIAFGSDFHHASQPCSRAEPSIFMCFTYGTKDPAQWDRIAETVTEQGIMYRHPQKGIVCCE